MRNVLLACSAGAALASGLLAASPAQANQGSPTAYFVCWSNLYKSEPFIPANQAVRLLNSVQESAASLEEVRKQWRDFANSAEPSLVLGSALCDSFSKRDRAEDRRASLTSRWRGTTIRPVDLAFEAETLMKAESPEPSQSANKEDGAAKRAVDEAAERREQREAEYQAKVAAHEAQVAEYQRKVKAREDEIARQQQDLAANAAEAARKKATHARLLEEHMKRQMDYEAARNRYTLCVNGNKEACAEIEAGKPAAGEKLADAGEAETSDDDARTCVSRPVVSASSTFKGQTQAVVFNGCRAAVDVRICLLRTGGWNCGVTWGLKPQDRWTHTSFQTQGEMFWDARMSGSGKALASPE